MKPSQYIALIIVIMMAWASLFITVLNQSQQTHHLLKNDQLLLQQDTAILNAQKTTEADLQMKIADLQAHVDCLFTLAHQGNPYARISDTACTITAPSVVHNTASPPTTKPTPSSSPTTTTSPPPPPTTSPSVICKLSFGLVGC